MKRLITLLLTALIVTAGYAAHVSEEEAYAKALEFTHGRSVKAKPKRVKGNLQETSPKNYYVFNIENNDGFVIVAGDDRVAPILGYADRGEFEPGKIPCGLKWLLDYYDSALSGLESVQSPSKIAAAKEVAGRNDISVLVDTKWGQGEPYNLNCPVFEGNKCITGCVATAMAQVINYHRWPQDYTSDVPEYVTASHGIQVPALPAWKFDWNNMGDAAISTLMRYCGQAVNMDYDTAASGAGSYAVPGALSDIFGYSRSVSLVSRQNYSDEEWDNMAYEELSKGQPILYFGQSPAEGGHAFIVDGYSEGMYHLNWGWEGYCDGYFTLDNLNPFSGDGFNYGQEMVLNSCPPAGADDTNRPKAIIRSFSCEDRILERDNAGSAFPSFRLSSVMESDVASDITLQVGFALYNDDGPVKMLYTTTCDFAVGTPVDVASDIALDPELTPGDYRIVAVSRSNDSGEWLSNAGSASVYVALTIGETSATIQPYPKSEEEENIVDYGLHTIDGITYRLVCEYGNFRAKLVALNGTDPYEGDLYVPDYVMFQNIRFNVTGIDYPSPFSDNDLLSSISIGFGGYFSISNCSNLTNIEFRDGVIVIPYIDYCPKLESLTIPKTCKEINSTSNCEKLASLVIHNEGPIRISQDYDGHLWAQESLPSLTDVYFTGDIPPSFDDNCAPVKPNENTKIHVPQNTKATYIRNGWNGWNIVEDQPAVPTYVKWDYCGDDFSNCCNLEMRKGIACGRGDNNVEFAMRIPKEHLTAYQGCRIAAVEYYTDPPADNDNQWGNVEYVFVTSPGKDYLAKQSATTVRGTWMRVDFKDQYVISNEDLFVGIGRNKVLSTNWANMNTVVDDGLWERVMGTDTSHGMQSGEWIKHCGMQDWFYSLPIRFIIEGESLPNDIVIIGAEITGNEDTPQSMPRKSAQETVVRQTIDISEGTYFTCTTDGKGGFYAAEKTDTPVSKTASRSNAGNSEMKVRFQNRSPRLVENITLDWSIDGVAQTPLKIETSLLTNHVDEAVVKLPDNLGGRTHTLVVDVSDIDGEPDEISANSNPELTISAPVSTHFPRKIVMEEATGTWCGYCPQGIATIEKMKERYPDNFIAIAIHDDDMLVKDGSYETFLNMISSFPSARVNRTRWQDLSPFDLDGEKDMADAMIDASAVFTEEGKINVHTETKFGFSESGNGKYNISYILLEDKVGPYYQANYYSNPSAEDNPDDYLNWWIHQGESVRMTYDDVARAIYNYDGIEGLVPDTFTEGESYGADYVVTIPGYVQNPANLKIVTLLIDGATGEIMNADSTPITGDVPELSQKVESITFDCNVWEGHVGDTFSIMATISPENAKDKSLSWTSSNEGVATVSGYGEVTAVGVGDCVITATAADGSNVSASCNVSVKPVIVLVESITIEPSAWSGEVGESIQLHATLLPENATDKNVVWSTSNQDVAVVNENGVVTAVGTGECVITATAADGSNVFASCNVSVKPVIVLVESITIEPSAWSGEEGESIQLQATLLPENATDKTVTWSTSNQDVAVVDQNGIVVSVNEGDCVITAATVDGSNLYAECLVTTVAGIDNIFTDADETFVLCDINGIILKKDCNRDYLKEISKGIYIILRGNQTQKIIIR